MAHSKRTKRYGGFLVGDRVQDRRGKRGTVVNMQRGRLTVQFDGIYNKFTIMPNQLINLTRQWEDKLKTPEDIIFGNPNENLLDFLKSVEEESKYLEEVKKEMFAEYLLANIEAMVEEAIERGKYVFCKAISNEINSIKLPPKPITFSPSDLPNTPLEQL